MTTGEIREQGKGAEMEITIYGDQNGEAEVTVKGAAYDSPIAVAKGYLDTIKALKETESKEQTND